jgi:4-amino-4-deoxy-L-arabinose transferase-like glycosyltransferase
LFFVERKALVPLSSDNKSLEKRPFPYRLITLLWIAVFLVFGLFTIRFYPPVNYNIGDEIWALQGSIDAVETGLPRQLVAPRLYFLLMGHFILLAGGGVFAARAFSLLAASCVLYVTYLLGREMKGGGAGLLSSVLLGTTFAFSWHGRIIRHEMLTALFIMGAVYLIYCAYVRGKGSFLLYGSFLAALSIHVHPNNLQYVLGLAPLYVVLFRGKALSVNSFYFLGGLIAGFVLWLVVGYYPSLSAAEMSNISPGDIVGVMPSPVASKGFFKVFGESLFSLPGDFMEYIRLFNIYFPNRINVAAAVGAGGLMCVLSLFTRYRWKALLLLFFVFISSFANYFITDVFGYWHVVELYPFLAIAIALGLYGVGEKTGSALRRVFVAAGALFFIAIGTADTAMTMYGMKDYDYQRLLDKVSREVDGRVLGMGLYSPAFKREDFVSPWFNIDRPSRDCPPFGDKVRELRVKYIIADEMLQSFSRMGCGPNYEKELVRYLFLKCKRVAEVDERYPNYWVDGGVIREIYIFRTPVD